MGDGTRPIMRTRVPASLVGEARHRAGQESLRTHEQQRTTETAPVQQPQDSAPVDSSESSAASQERAQAQNTVGSSPVSQAPDAQIEAQRNVPTPTAGLGQTQNRATVDQALTTTPEAVQAGGRTFQVYGANAREREAIQRSLTAIPPEHIHTLPEQIVVADQVGGNRTSGGNTVMRGNTNRIELSTASLNPQSPHCSIDSAGRSLTLLHEAGHAVDRGGRGGGLSWRTQQSLSPINAAVANPPSDPEALARRQAMENFAQGYMYYVTNSTRLNSRQRAAMDSSFAFIRPPQQD